MNAASWIAVTWILTNGTVQTVKAGLGYRTARRRDETRKATTP